MTATWKNFSKLENQAGMEKAKAKKVIKRSNHLSKINKDLFGVTFAFTFYGRIFERSYLNFCLKANF